MLCRNCPHFRIIREPEKIGDQLVDWGTAACDKYDMVTDFNSHRKFEWLSCIEKEKKDEG